MVLPQQIQREASEMKMAGWKIEINYGIPTISVNPPEGEGWFIQGDDASNLIQEAQSSPLANEMVIEDIILWSASGWTSEDETTTESPEEGTDDL